MTKRRYPILAAVIGLVLAGCGGNSDDYTISVTVSGRSASERALGHRHGNSAPGFADAVTAPTLRQITPCGGTHGGRRGQCYGDGRSRWCLFTNSWTARRLTKCLEPGRIAGQRDGIDGAYNCLYEHREPENAVRKRIYP